MSFADGVGCNKGAIRLTAAGRSLSKAHEGSALLMVLGPTKCEVTIPNTPISWPKGHEGLVLLMVSGAKYCDVPNRKISH